MIARNRLTFALPWLLLGVFFVQGLFLIRAMSATADEATFNIVNGYSYLKTRDYRMSPANPALLREWEALPLLFLKPRLDLNKDSWREAETVPFAREFLYTDNRELADRILNWARFMNLLLGLALGFVVYSWSRDLYGDWGGILSLAFYVFCPNLLAHSSIAGTDIGVTLFSVMAAFSLWKYLESLEGKGLWLFCLSLALACAAKYNALIFVPLFLGIVWAKRGYAAFKTAAFSSAFLAFLLVWASYGFEFKPLLSGAVPRDARHSTT